jgi:hypothetical protein
MSRDELDAYLHQHASGLAPRISQRKMAEETGWSQSSVCRKLHRQQEQTVDDGGARRLRGDADEAAKKFAAMPAASRGDAADATAASASPTSSSASRRHPAAIPHKMPRDELHAYLRQYASRLAPRISQRKMAGETGWSQPSVCRKLRRQREGTVHAAGKRLRTAHDARNAIDAAGDCRRCRLHRPVMQVCNQDFARRISDAGCEDAEIRYSAR